LAGGGITWTRITPAQAGPADRPDWRGDSIAFQTAAGGFVRIAASRKDGSGFAIYPAPPGANERAPRWVDSTLLVYSGDQIGTEDIWYLDLATNATRRLTNFAGGEWDPAPRPGSPGLVYIEAGDSLGGRLTLLPDTAAAPLAPVYLTPVGLKALEPSFDVAGDRICFAARGAGASSQIWTVTLSSPNPPVQLTTGGNRDRSPRFSPDGTKILFISNRGGRWGLWTVSPQGEGVALGLLTYDAPWAELRHAAWSPSGGEIVVSSDRQGERALWVLSNLSP